MSQNSKELKTPSIANGLKWMYLSSFMQAGLRIFVLAVLARLLLPSDFGLLGIALIFTSCAERLGQVGVGPAVVQKETLTELDITTASSLSIWSGMLIAVALSVLAPFVGDFFEAPRSVGVLQVLALGFIIDGFGVIPDSILQRRLQFRQVMFSENLSYLVGNVCVGTALALLGYGVWSLVFSNLSMKIVRVAILRYSYSGPWFGSFNFPTARGLLHTGVGFSLGRVLSFIALQGDNFIVGRILGVEMLGMYTRAYQLMTLPATYFGQALERVLFPAMAKKQSETAKLVEIFNWSIEIVTVVALPISIGMFFLAHEIIAVLFGAKWLGIVPTLTILSLGVFFRSAYKCSDTLARSCGAVYQHALRQALYSCLVVLGATCGALLWGLVGVAFAVVAAVAINYILMTLLSAKLLHIPISALLKPHLPGVWVSSWLAILLALIVPWLRSAVGSPLLVLCLACVFSGFAILIVLITAPNNFKSTVLGQIVARIPFQKFGLVGKWCSDNLQKLS